MFKQATKLQSKLRMTIDGPAGSGKTFTALRFAHALQEKFGGKIAFIDTERGSASKYVGESPDGIPWEFDVLELTTFSPEKYTEAINLAGRMGYSVLVVDSLSHAWEGAGGALEIKQKYGESWSSWRHVTPIHNKMVDAILQCPCHVITSMRSRMEYVQENDSNGKTVIRRVGMAPVQRPGMEFEFDILCDMDWAHIMTVAKSRCSAVADMTVEKPGPDFMRPVIEWLSAGGIPQQPEPVFVPAEPVSSVSNAITLDELLGMFPAEAILEKNDGRIPSTQEEVDKVASLLAGV